MFQFEMGDYWGIIAESVWNLEAETLPIINKIYLSEQRFDYVFISDHLQKRYLFIAFGYGYILSKYL